MCNAYIGKHCIRFNYYIKQIINSFRTILFPLMQVCKGATYLERHNYIHLDLAAGNRLFGSENKMKVTDL